MKDKKPSKYEKKLIKATRDKMRQDIFNYLLKHLNAAHVIWPYTEIGFDIKYAKLDVEKILPLIKFDQNL